MRENKKDSFDLVPASLKKSGLFCLWKYEPDKNGRITKVPYSIRGHRANPARKADYADWQLALEHLADYDGIGVGVFDRLSMIDIDRCVFQDGSLSEMAEDIVSLMDSYTEISPSGTGLRIIFYADAEDYDRDRFYINNQSKGLEVYVADVTKKYCTVTGKRIYGHEIEERGRQLLTVLEKYMERPARRNKTSELSVPGSYLSDESVIAKAKSAENGTGFTALWNGEIPEGKSHSEADMALACRLVFWCGGDLEQVDRLMRKSGLYRPKWDRAQSGSTYGLLTMEKALSLTGEFYQPYKPSSATDDFDTVLPKLQELRPEDNPRYTWNDSGSGRLFADVFKDIARYVPERKKWYVYDGKRWFADMESLKTMELAKGLGDSLIRYCLTIKDERKRKDYLDYAGKWQVRNRRITYIRDAESVYPLSMKEFDQNIYYFNCQNVTLDLRTGTAHEHCPEDFISKISRAHYEPEANYERFTQFIDEIMSRDDEKAKYLQKIYGYGLSGDTGLEIGFVEYGSTTRNGKGTLNESVLHMMGDYGVAMRPESLAAKQVSSSQAPSEDIARLDGARFVTISEPKRGLVFNEALLKSMLGNDTLNARFLHENSFDFKPQCKLYMNTNYLPVITDMTIFRSGRLHVIPFDRHFEEHEQDKSLKRKFRSEEAMSAILNWMLDGYRLLQKEGLQPPDSVREATEGYARESNKIGLFAEEHLEEDGSGEVRTSAVYDSYRSWCAENGHYTENKRNFNQALRTIGTLERKRPRDGGEKTTLLIGYRLREEAFL
jgi:putative DNA primase/helicase